MLAAACLFALLLILLGWGRQTLWSLRLARHFPLGPPVEDPADKVWPHAVVLLPVRGADPMLSNCLTGLCEQDHPNYSIFIILDQEDDPSLPIIREVQEKYPHAPMTILPLVNRLESCSLKVSAILQGVAELPSRTGVVALIDADGVPPPHWLRDLARPFEDPTIGAVSGLRWFHTHDRAWGSLVRWVWGAGATAQMYNLDILWGGSLAFRAEVIRDPELKRIWSQSFVEDTSAVAFLQSRNWKMRFLPSLTLINPEAISLPACYRFLRRQVFCVRLHHPRWNDVFWTSAFSAASVPATLAAATFAWALGQTMWAVGLLVALVAGILGTGLPLAWIDGCFYFASPPDNRISNLSLKHIPVVPLTITMYIFSVAAACRMREIDWRGIRYRLDPDHRIHRLNDGPYLPNPQAHEHAHSIV